MLRLSCIIESILFLRVFDGIDSYDRISDSSGKSIISLAQKSGANVRKPPIVFSNGSRGSGSFLSEVDAYWVSAFSTCSCGT